MLKDGSFLPLDKVESTVGHCSCLSLWLCESFTFPSDVYAKIEKCDNISIPNVKLILYAKTSSH